MSSAGAESLPWFPIQSPCHWLQWGLDKVLQNHSKIDWTTLLPRSFLTCPTNTTAQYCHDRYSPRTPRNWLSDGWNSLLTLFCCCNSYAPERCHHLPLIAHNTSLHPHAINIQTSAFMFLPHCPSCLGGNVCKHLHSYFIISPSNSFLRLLFPLISKKPINQKLTAVRLPMCSP